MFLLTYALALSPAFGDEDMAPPELPFWPIALYAPPSFRQLYPPVVKRAATTNDAPPGGDILVWIPPDTKRIRAVLLIVNNAQSKHFGEHPALREVARKQGMAVLYMRRDRPRPPMKRDPAKGTYVWDESADAAFRSDIPRPAWWLTPHEDLGDAQLVMDYVAQKTGVPEFRHAPWITYGQSSRGRFPFHMAWKFPRRTIATIDHHAETPTWPPEEWAAFEDETILHVNLNGELEWGATFAVHVRPSLLNYRARTPWLPHLAVAQGIDHTNYSQPEPPPGQNRTGRATQTEVWDYLSVFVDKALGLRLPPEGFPTDAPFKLRKIDPSTGCLIERFAVEDILQRPRLQLVESNGLYVVNAALPEFNGYAAIPPATGFTPPAGVPVVQIESGVSPTNWLLSGGLSIVMKADPLQDVSAFEPLRPKPGDEIEIDGIKTTFHPITEPEIGRREKVAQGIACRAIKGGGKDRKLTFLGYTVLDVREPRAFKVKCGHTVAVRSRMILNGVPVDNNQVVQLEKGLYPMLIAVRMDAILWGHFEPALTVATDADIAGAKESEAGRQKTLAEFRERLAAKRPPASYIHKFGDVPEAERTRMFWIADEEQAAAWVKLHDPALRRPE
jgi:hypothetical protein